jgi:hypothetical protein
VIWQIGHFFKPEFFASDQPPYPFYEAVPMPGLVLATFLPFWEKARTLSRFIFIAGIGLFVLVGYEVGRIRRQGVRVLVATLLVIEIIPPPVSGVPFPIPSHPAFEWLKAQSLPQEGIVDLYAPQPHTLALAIRGETLWATRYHERPTVSGTSGVWPEHTVFLLSWLQGHPHPFRDPDFIPILREAYHVQFILLHMQGEYETESLEEARSSTDVELIGCFEPPLERSPWPYPICILKTLSPSGPHLNVLFRGGWSPEEPWGIWADGVESHAQWVATSAKDYRLSWEAFPQCAPGKDQGITLEVNGVQLVTHQWENCEPWSGEIIIPASLVQIGWNDMQFHYAYAARPVDVTAGANPDLRMLSVGFTKLEVQESR